MAKTFTLTNPTNTGVSLNGGTHNGSSWSFSGTSTGIWIPLTPSQYQSFWVEFDFQFFGAIPKGSNLAYKAGSFGLKISDTGRLYLDSITTATDVAAGYNLSADKEEGNTVLKSGMRYKVRFEYDHATSLVRVLLNGYEEIRYYRIRKPGKINMTGDKLTCFQGLTDFNLYSLTVGNDRPAVRSMRLVARNGVLYIDRLDPTFSGKELRIFVESPYGMIIQETSIFPVGPTDATFLVLEPGTNAVTVQCGTFQQTLLIQSGNDAEMPKDFLAGFYNVRNGDMALAKSNNATVAASDWVLQRTVPPAPAQNTPYERLKLYADAAQAAGMGLIPICNITNGKDTPLLPEFANHPGIHSFLLGDEIYGNMGRFVESYHAIRTQTKKPVWGSLNKFNIIPLVPCDGLFLNIYNLPPGDTRKITELVTYAAQWGIPVIVVLGYYDNVKPSEMDFRRQIKVAKSAGAVGVLVFELDHREKETSPGWYIPVSAPDMLLAIKDEFGLSKV